MSDHYAELLMYVAPEPIEQANQQWLARILDHLNLGRAMPITSTCTVFGLRLNCS